MAVSINLDNYVSDVDNVDAEMVWTYSGNAALTVSLDVNRVATITIPDLDWSGSETIWFRAADPGILADSNDVTFTVNAVNGNTFELNIVPHTLQETIMSGYAPGTEINLEVDLIARYLERLLLGDRAAEKNAVLGVDMNLLAQSGFLDK